MDAKVKFNLRSNTPGTATPIILILNFNNERLKYSTGEKINPDYWNFKTQRPKTKKELAKLTKELVRDLDSITFKLNEYQSAAKRYFENLTFNSEQPTPEKLKELFDYDFRPEPQPERKEKTVDLNAYITQYIKDIKSGARLTTNGQRFKPNTFKNFDSFQTKFDDYQKDKRKRLNFEHITIDFYASFTEYFTRKDYKLNTIGRHIKTLKTLMRAAREEGHHQNNEIDRKQFRVFRTETDSVYLTEKELEQLRTVDLSDSPQDEIIRDVFLVGCYTAQRFSDYHRLNETHIKTLQNGAKTIELHQTKTGEKVTIPVKPELLEILTKYNFTLPKTHEQKVNKGIKDIAAKAKIEEQISIEQIKGGLKVKTTVPKHRLITTHTARRTGATLMYLAGIPTIAAMKITGHRSEKQFLQYIRVTNEENATALTLHPYFSSQPLKVVK